MAKTVIGPDTRVAGALHGKDELLIEGTVEGPVTGEAKVTVGKTGRVGGAVRGHDVVIAGKLAFDVFASGTIHLEATAEVSGNLEAPRIAIDEGAVFEGQVRMRRKEAQAQVAAPAVREAAPAVREAVPAVREAAPAVREAAPAARQPAPAPRPRREIPELPSVGKTRLQRRTS